MTDIMYKMNYTELHMRPNKVRYIRIIKPLLSQYDRSPSVSFETCCSGEKKIVMETCLKIHALNYVNWNRTCVKFG